VGSRTSLDAVAKRKSHHCYCWNLRSGRSSRNLVSVLTELFELIMC